MSESKNTQVKVEYHQYDDGTHVCVADKKGDWVADCGREGDKEAETNAARIVQCWNEYDQLKADNERLKKQVDGLLETGSSKLSIQQSKNLLQRATEAEALNRELAEALIRCKDWFYLNGKSKKIPLEGVGSPSFLEDLTAALDKYNSVT